MKLYIERHEFISYDESKPMENSFMGWWTLTFRFVQIFYLLGVMISIIIYTAIIFLSRLKFEEAELYTEYVK